MATAACRGLRHINNDDKRSLQIALFVVDQVRDFEIDPQIGFIQARITRPVYQALVRWHRGASTDEALEFCPAGCAGDFGSGAVVHSGFVLSTRTVAGLGQRAGGRKGGGRAGVVVMTRGTSWQVSEIAVGQPSQAILAPNPGTRVMCRSHLRMMFLLDHIPISEEFTAF